ncbi:alginate O-acetyltransferase AlgX-related protein [Algimonas arctica]|nr:hypothetical protein [Algimonas arctica]
MERWIRNIAMTGLLIAFLTPALGFAVNAVRGYDGISATEQRVLAKIPSFQGSARSFTSEFDVFLEDNFGFRMLLIRVARKIRDNLGENPPQVAVGQDGWLFLGSASYQDEFEGYGRWDADHVQAWIDSLSEVKTALAEKDIPFAAFIAVDKARVYPEKTPQEWQEGERRLRTALHNHPDVARTGLIDVEPLVQSAKARGKQTFYLGDTHWTSDGTYDVAMAVLDVIDPLFVRPRFLPDAPVPQIANRVLDLEAMSGRETSQEPTHVMINYPPTKPGFRTSLTLLDDGTPDPGQFSTIRILGTDNAPQGTLLIVGDSFGDAMVGHFRPSYSEIIRIHHGAHFRNVALAEVLSYKPDAVLFVTAERQAVSKDRPFAPLVAPIQTETTTP